MLQLNTILGFQYRAWTRLRLQTFMTRLENESRVGTQFAEIWNYVIAPQKILQQVFVIFLILQLILF